MVAAVPLHLATAPRVLAIASLVGSDERSVNEMTGWLIRAASLGCLHHRATLVDHATLSLLGGRRTTALISLAVRAGLLAPAGDVDGIPAYRVHPGIARPARPDPREG